MNKDNGRVLSNSLSTPTMISRYACWFAASIKELENSKTCSIAIDNMSRVTITTIMSPLTSIKHAEDPYIRPNFCAQISRPDTLVRKHSMP